MPATNSTSSPRQPLVLPSVLQKEWKGYEKLLFQFSFLYFFLQCVPLDWKYYRQLFSIKWSHLHYGDIFNLAHYAPHFFSGTDQRYADWGIVLIIAFIGTAVWTWADRNRTREYSVLYYWIRVIVRYRLAVAIIAYGVIKFIPVQAPYPSISNLNTAYGDFTRWKLFALSLGIVPSYESFLGLVEIVLGLLLLYRKTASIAAFMILVFTGNVFMSNIAYEGGEYVYSAYLLTLAAFVLVFDLQRMVSLLVWQRPTAPNTFKPVFTAGWLQKSRLPLKAFLVFFFVVIYGFQTVQDSYHYPRAKGLPGISGIYNVAEFSINNHPVAYSKTDPIRWQDVVFEEWNTISIRSNRPVIIDSNNVETVSAADKERNYELEGTTGRHYYSYKADTVNHVLRLYNRNKHYPDDTLVLHYALDDACITLSGTGQQHDSVYAVLNKLNKKYLVQEAARLGRRGRLKL